MEKIIHPHAKYIDMPFVFLLKQREMALTRYNAANKNNCESAKKRAEKLHDRTCDKLIKHLN